MRYTILLLIAYFTVLAFNAAATEHNNDSSITVPAGGNTWCLQCNNESEIITDDGIQNWVLNTTVLNTYIRLNHTGNLNVKINARTDKKSIIQITVAGKKRNITVEGNEFKAYDAGAFFIKDTGYITITLRGRKKQGELFADVSGYNLSGNAVNTKTAFVKNNETNFFYWGRRGPSVHLSYPFADSIKAEWFYNELTVPENQDVMGSYFMANGFNEGYFGMQVNSPTERRILFSVWSPFNTDNPKDIPDDKRITLLKKGEDVHTGEFGNEGSGGQSFLRYNWKAGLTYKFLLHGLPDGNGNTIYTAYFFEPEKSKWLLIASFKRPHTNTYLKRVHSFLENFLPSEGDKTREVYLGNQWIRDNAGKWKELTQGVFTYDNTAAKKYRMDYAGGVEQGKFYLKNCGFFNHFTAYRSSFQRDASNNQPVIDFTVLP